MAPPNGPGVPPAAARMGAPGPTTPTPGLRPTTAEGAIVAGMRNTSPKTVRVGLTNSRVPTTIYVNGLVPVRIVIRNIGAASVFLGTEFSSTISAAGLPGSDTNVLPPDVERVIVLAPKQGLYATSLVFGRVTFMASDALPVL